MAPQRIESLGSLLSYGAIGLGLAVAILTVILLRRPNQKTPELITKTVFMVFGLLLVVIGAGLEFYKAYESGRQAERVFLLSLSLPDEFWEDFMLARRQTLFGTAAPTDEHDKGHLMIDETKERPIRIPSGECRYYFAAARPPARIGVTVAQGAATHRQMHDKGYYQTGKICAAKDGEVQTAKLRVRMTDARSQYAVAVFVAPSDEAGPRAAPVRKIFCNGEFAGNCAGTHDVFRACGSGSDQEIAAGICSPGGVQSVRRLHTKSGNKCGYSLTEVMCL